MRVNDDTTDSSPTSIWIACLFNIVAYVPLYWVLRGTLVVDGWRLRRPKTQPDRAIFSKSNQLALKMLM